MEEQTEVVDSPQQNELNLADVSTDDLRQALSTQQLPEATEQIEQAEPEGQPQEEAPVQEEPVAEEPQAPEETPVPEESEEDRLAKRRIRPKSELDQQVIDLYRSEGFSGTFADASRIIYGQEVAPNQPNPQPAQQSTEQPISNSYEGLAETLNAEIAELESEVTQAADDLDTVKALQLQREIMKKELEVRDLNFRKERAQEKAYEAHSSNQRSKAQESRDRAFESYPDLSDKSTVYRKEFDDFISQAQNDADYEAVFQSPRWPEMMAHDFAARKGYQAPAQNASNPAPEIPRQVSPQMGNQAKVLTTGQTAQPANTQITPEYVSNNIGQMSNDQLYQLLGHDDGRKFLR
jgi:hypothetical protein